MVARSERIPFPYVAAISLLLGVSFGVAFAPEGSNQLVYVTQGLRLLDPDFLRFDWWAAETSAYHPRFAYLVAALEYIGALRWSLAVANVFLVAATAWLVLLLVRALDRQHAFIAWLLCLLLFAGLTGGKSVASSYLYDESLQASSIATFATVAAILLFVKQRFLYSGIALGVAGFFHTNFLLLGFPVFGAVHLILRTPGFFRRTFLQMAPAALVLAVDVPLILDISGFDLPADIRAAANRLVIDVAAPHHYRPRSFLTEFFPLIGWQVAALGVIGLLPGERDVRRNFVAVYLALLAVVGVGTVLTTVVAIDSVARLFVWRMAPFLLLCAHMAIALVAVRLFREDPARARTLVSPAQMIIFGIGIAMVLAFFLRRMPPYDPRLWLSLVGAAALGIGWMRVRSGAGFPGSGPRPVAVILVVALVLARVPQMISEENGRLTLSPTKFNLIHATDTDRARAVLYDWVRTTAPDSRFLIPPMLSGFRLYSGRAVVVDWKGRPFRPDELVEWHRRMVAVTGLVGWKSLDELDKAYDRRTTADIRQVAMAYGVRYVVLHRMAVAHPDLGAPVFQNTLYRVYSVGQQSGQPSSGGTRR